MEETQIKQIMPAPPGLKAVFENNGQPECVDVICLALVELTDQDDGFHTTYVAGMETCGDIELVDTCENFLGYLDKDESIEKYKRDAARKQERREKNKTIERGSKKIRKIKGFQYQVKLEEAVRIKGTILRMGDGVNMFEKPFPIDITIEDDASCKISSATEGFSTGQSIDEAFLNLFVGMQHCEENAA